VLITQVNTNQAGCCSLMMILCLWAIVGRVLGLISSLPRRVLDRVGAVLMGSVDGDCGVGEVRYGIFSVP